MSISDSLKHLEQSIGFPPFMGAPYGQEAIGVHLRQDVVSWLTIKGIDKSSLDKSSLTTLGKMYKVERYFDSVMLNQERDNKKKPYKKFSPIISTEGWDTPNEPLTFSSPHPSIIKSDTKTIEDISQLDLTIHNIVKENIFNENKKFQDQITGNVLQWVREELDASWINNTQTIKDIVEQTTKNEIKMQGEENKKFIEEQIFQGYLNHKKQNLNDAPAPTPLESIESNNLTHNTHTNLIPTPDPNYHFDPYATKVIRSALSMCENLYVYGDTGCGKTTHLEQVCAVMSRGLVRINPHDGITREMFLGGMKLINNETIFIEGALPIAMRNGHVLLVDEISFLPPNLTAILNPVGEKGGKLYIPETSEWVSPAPGFCIFATDNTGGKGDRTGNYTGTEVQNTATLDRFAFCLKMDYLPINKETEMLINRFPNQDISEIGKMLNLAKDIRRAFSRGELSLTLSTRKLIKFFDQREHNFSIQEALSNTILSWLDEDDETLVKTMIDRLDLLLLTQTPPNSKDLDLKDFQYEIRGDRLLQAIKVLRRIVAENGGNLSLQEAKNIVEKYRDCIIHLDDVKRDLEVAIKLGK